MNPYCGVLRDDHFRVLSEVAARGAIDAAAGLSEMMGREIRIRAPELSLLKIGQVPSLLAGPEEVVVGVYLAMGGDIMGHILLLLSPEEAGNLVDMLMGLPSGSTTALGTMERSALGEVGNLTGSFFLNALAEATSLRILPSPPAVIVDMGAAVLDIPLVALARSGDQALVINTQFADHRRQVEASFLVMPDMPSLKTLVKVLEKRWATN